MSAMRASHGGDLVGMAGGGEPVVHGGADAAALDWRLARPVMAGDQEQEPITTCDRLFEAAVDRSPCRVEVHAMKVENSVGLDRAASQFLVPTPVERAVTNRGRSRPG